MPFTYGELQAEMDLINRAYIDVMCRRRQGPRLHLPIPDHHNITARFRLGRQNAAALFEMTRATACRTSRTFVELGLEPNMIRSMCCRLQLDLRELLKRGNGLFGSAEQTGSLGVVTVNCARLGHLHAGDEAALLARLDELLELSRKPEVKRKGHPAPDGPGPVPHTKRYLGTLRNHFSTLGVNGINEDDPQLQRRRARHHQPQASSRARLLDHVRARMVAFQEETGHPLQPGRRRRRHHHRFAKDRKRFPRHRSRQAPPASRTTPTRRNCRWAGRRPVRGAHARREELQTKYTGGTVLHLYMNEARQLTRSLPRPGAARSSASATPYIT